MKKIVAAPPEEKIKVNKAKAAFDEYRKKMEASKMAAPRIESRSAAPFASPSFHGMPFMPHAAHQAGMPPYLPHQAIPSPAIMIPRGSLFEGIGSMLRLGVDVMNAGLAGGSNLWKVFHTMNQVAASLIMKRPAVTILPHIMGTPTAVATHPAVPPAVIAAATLE